MLRFLFIFLINHHWNSVECLNILGLFPYEGRSHFFVYEKYLQELAERGHNVTVISHFPRQEIIPNYHDVSLTGKIEKGKNGFVMERSYWLILKAMDYAVEAGMNNCKLMLENKSVQELWKSNRTFDLVVMQHFNSDCALGLAYKLGTPVVGLTAHTLMPWHYRTFGIPFNPSYSSFVMSSSFNPTLYERVEKTVLDFIYYYKHVNARKVDQETLGKYFDDVPPLEQLSRQMKFLLLYQYYVLSGSKLLPPNVVEVGGYHVVPSKPLPTDLQKFIDESENGVIYISFGTMLQESTFPKYKIDAILDTLAKLPQRVVWKWNGLAFPKETKNIYVSKWLPQNDLLAHPNVLAFFSHGGLLSTTEAAHHGVPMIIMPVIADQPLNAASVVISGFGVQIALSDLTKENLLNKFSIVLDPEFRKRLKILSKSFSDRPVTAMNNAIFWTEFAARYNLTINTPAADVPWYQYICLDILAFFAVFVIIWLYVIVKILSLIVSIIRNMEESKRKLKSN